MRIAHVVTYISPDGAFGGPLRVALGQAEALAKRGHEVTVYAGSPSSKQETVSCDGYLLKTFPAKMVSKKLGFAGLIAPMLTKELSRDLRYLDVAHVHLARDLVTLPAVRVIRKSKTPYLVQSHGMIDRSSNLLSVPIDWWETRKAPKGARTVIALTDGEVNSLRQVVSDINVSKLGNGIKLQPIPAFDGRPRRVLFMARMHSIKRPTVFVKMAKKLVEAYPDVEFLMAGPDEGELARVLRTIAEEGLEERIRWIGAVSPAETDALMQSAQVYVLPSESEVFPMAVIEAFRAGTPSVICDSFGIATDCSHYDAALVTNGSVSELAAATSLLLDNREASERLRLGANRYLKERLDIDRVAQRLEASYVGAADARGALARQEKSMRHAEESDLP